MKKIILSDPKDFSFSSAKNLFNFRTAIVVGACRSGKTSLGWLRKKTNNGRRVSALEHVCP